MRMRRSRLRVWQATRKPLLFDVAPETKVVNIELHDTPLSPGVKVKLS